MDPQAAKLIGAGIAATALIGAGLGIGNIFGSDEDAAGTTASPMTTVIRP